MVYNTLNKKALEHMSKNPVRMIESTRPRENKTQQDFFIKFYHKLIFTMVPIIKNKKKYQKRSI